MKKLLTLFRQAIAITHTAFPFILVYFAVGETFLEANAQLVWLRTLTVLSPVQVVGANLIRVGSLLLMVAAVAAKIALFPGIYAGIVRLAAGEEMGVRVRDFWQDCRGFWKVTGLAGFSYLAVCMIAGRLFFSGEYQRLAVYAVFEVALFFFLADWMIRKRYGLMPGRGRFPVMALLVIAFVSLANAFLGRFWVLFPGSARVMSQAAILAAGYIHVFGFSLAALAMADRYKDLPRSFDHKKELYLVSPIWMGLLSRFISNFARFYPPAFAVLRALTPPDYHVRDLDYLTWRSGYYRPGKLVAITCFTINSYQAYKVAKEFKKAGSCVVMGGPHVTCNADEALEFCDSVVLGEAESVWAQVISDYEAGSLKKIYEGKPLADFWAVGRQAFGDLPFWMTSFMLETTRGCKYACEFCAIPGLAGSGLRHRPMEDVLAQVLKIKRSGHNPVFTDNNIFGDPVYAKELFRRLAPLKISWSGSCSIDIADDAEALGLAKQSGCDVLLVGYEIVSGSPEAAGKFSYAARYLELSRKLKRAGIKIKAHFILGFDSDDLRYFFKMIRFIFRLNPEYAVISFLTPLPGTRLWKRLLGQSRITNLNWQAYDLGHLVFKHPRLGGFELTVFNLLRHPIHFFGSTLGRWHLFWLLAVLLFFK